MMVKEIFAAARIAHPRGSLLVIMKPFKDYYRKIMLYNCKYRTLIVRMTWVSRVKVEHVIRRNDVMAIS